MVHALILVALALAYGAAWAVWRRTYGGGDGWLLRVAGWAPFLWKWEDGQKKVRRGPWLAVGSLLTIPVWFILPPWQAAVAAVTGRWPRARPRGRGGRSPG